MHLEMGAGRLEYSQAVVAFPLEQAPEIGAVGVEGPGAVAGQECPWPVFSPRLWP